MTDNVRRLPVTPHHMAEMSLNAAKWAAIEKRAQRWARWMAIVGILFGFVLAGGQAYVIGKVHGLEQEIGAR